MKRRHIGYLFAMFMMLWTAYSYAQVNTWQDIYKVKKKDTIFGIAQRYGITIVDLMEANPEMKQEGYQLKKGTTLFVPFPKKAVVAATPVAKKEPTRTDVRKRAIKVGIMLPLHNVDGDGRRMVEYYRGFLMACEELKTQGISVDVHARNVPIDADIRQTLLDKNAKDCDIIFGPLYTPQVKALGDFCKTYRIKMVIPFSITSDEVTHNPQIFQIYQSVSATTNQSISAFMERFPNHHPIFIDCNDSTSKKGAFTFGLRNQLEKKGIKYSITNLKSSEEQFAKAFSRSQPNVVILNTGRSPELNIAFAKLNSLATIAPNLSISLFGYTEWLMYTKYNLENFHKFDTYIPTTFYYNPLSAAVQRIERNYRKWFKQEMQQALPRFALTGYDHANYFLQGLHKYGEGFKGSKSEAASTPVQTQLHFVKHAEGGMQNANFVLIHYKTNQNIESISY